jgi:hypothetical protein
MEIWNLPMHAEKIDMTPVAFVHERFQPLLATRGYGRAA